MAPKDLPPFTLQASCLKKSYSNTVALNNLSFNIEKGKCLALLGPNGAGKTTTCDLLTGISQPDSGTLKFGTLDYKNNRQVILEKLGVHLQDTKFYGKYSVKETFTLFASFYKKTVPIETILNNFSLWDERHKRLEKLSTGQRQRVYLGCSLIHSPDILILDEPTTSLDPSAKHEVWNLINQLKQQNKSLFLTTHNMEEAEELSDYVLILDKGKLVSEGTASELIRTGCGEDIISFSFANKHEKNYTILSKKLNWLASSKTRGNCYEIGTNYGKDYLRDLAQLSQQENIVLNSLSLRKSNLEDVFLRLTGRTIKNDS